MWNNPQIIFSDAWYRYRRVVLVVALGVLIALSWLAFSQSMATQAAQTPTITITPITWDTIGIDSIYTTTTTTLIGPNRFPVGARVCSTQPVNPLVAKFVWLSSETTNYVDIIGPTVFTDSVTTTEPCEDFYFTAEVTRNSASFSSNPRLYTIQVTGQGISSPISYTSPRFLAVVRLSRYANANLVSLRVYNPSNPSAQSFPIGSLVTYTLHVSNTVPISYSQLVNSLTQSNQVFQLVRVIGRYSNPPGSFTNIAYTDACGWINNQCVGPVPSNFPNGVVGGNMHITYTLRAQTVGTTSLTPLVYGFTQPNTGIPVYQYEYNANNSISAGVFDPNPPSPSASIDKSVSPGTAAINDILNFSIVVKNTGTATLATWTMNDTFPLAVDLLSASSTAGTVSSNTSTKTVSVTGTNLAPNATVTITIQCRVNSSATVNATINNTATLAYTFNNVSYSASDTAGFRVSGTSLPGTGGVELDQAAGQPIIWLPILMAVLIGFAGIAILFLGVSSRSRGSEWAGWLSKTGAILLVAAFVFGIIGWAVNRSPASTTVAVSEQAEPAAEEVNMDWLSATEAPWEDFPASNANDELPALPDFPIPAPEIENPPAAGEPEPDTSPVVRIRIPALGVDTVVKYVPYDGQSWLISGLKQEVAWMGDTSWPGLGGNTAFAGHVTLSDGSNGPFRTLADLGVGELVVLYTEKNTYTYKVRQSLIVEDEDLSVLKPSGNPEITLITCAEWDTAQQAYLKRFIVYSDLVSTNPITLQDRGN